MGSKCQIRLFIKRPVHAKNPPRELLCDLHRSGATICMVTHDPRFARYAARTVHLFDGRIVEESLESEQAPAVGSP